MDTLRNGGRDSDCGRMSRTGWHKGGTKTVIGRRSHFEKIQFMRTELIGIAKLWEEDHMSDGLCASIGYVVYIGWLTSEISRIDHT